MNSTEICKKRERENGRAEDRKGRCQTFCSQRDVPIKKRFLRWFTGAPNWIANLSLRELLRRIVESPGWIMTAGNRCHWPLRDTYIYSLSKIKLWDCASYWAFNFQPDSGLASSNIHQIDRTRKNRIIRSLQDCFFCNAHLLESSVSNWSSRP